MIEVRSCARLHLGLLDNNGDQGRLYGSIGLAVNHPYLLLKAEEADSLIVDGLEADRVAGYARRFIEHYGLPRGARLRLIAGIPAHVGLGSGTQIALAVGTALARLAGLDLTVEEIALAGGRGARSGIGIAAFRRGGFILDGGHRVCSEASPRRAEESSVPPILFHHSVPKDWRFVTVIPANNQGFSGEKEKKAFMRLAAASPQLAEKLSRLVLGKMLPALVEKDIHSFGQAITAIQQTVGDCFAPVQGGRFSNPISEKVVGFLLAQGAAGAGQSSWGPAVYGLVEGEEPALLLTEKVRAYLSELGGGDAFCVQPRNRGADIRLLSE